MLGYVSPKEQGPSATRGSRPGSPRDLKTPAAYSNIANISAIYEWIWKKLEILVGPHVLSKRANFCKNHSMNACMTSMRAAI